MNYCLTWPYGIQAKTITSDNNDASFEPFQFVAEGKALQKTEKWPIPGSKNDSCTYMVTVVSIFL
jgi:hypothetical protein